MGSAGKRPDRSADISGNSSHARSAFRATARRIDDSESPAFRSDRSSRSPGAAGTRAPDTSTALEGRSRSASLSRWIREARPVRRAAAEAIRSALTVRVANGAFSSCSIRPANSARAYATSSRESSSRICLTRSLGASLFHRRPLLRGWFGRGLTGLARARAPRLRATHRSCG